jgi:SAM-dependent methyltransferase
MAVGEKSFRQLAGTLVRRLRRSDHGGQPVAGVEIEADLARIDAAFQKLLGRALDSTSEDHFRQVLQHRHLSADQIIESVAFSPERILRQTDLLNWLHRGREAWAASLPAWSRILDIGGSSPTTPEGALIELGYRHRPQRLDILDRPIDDQFHGRPTYDQVDTRFPWGEVRYHHGHAEQIDEIERLNDAWFDAVFMGQTIEHIELEHLDSVLGFIGEHLTADGVLVFDTPNRSVAADIFGTQFIAADHTHEFDVAEMVEIVERNGFRVTQEWGILASSERPFNPFRPETISLVSDTSRDAFVFALACQRA